MKEESEKVGLKLNIQKTKIMASGPIASWQIDGETVADFIFLGSKITADGDCRHEIKRCLLIGRKVMTNLDSMFKQRHYFANDFKEIYKSSVPEETFFSFFAHTISARLMIKRHLLLGRKVTTNLDSIFKSRDITLPTKGSSSQGYGFSSSHVWM